MPLGGVIRGTLNLFVTTLVDDVGLCQVDIEAAFNQIRQRIHEGCRGGSIDVNVEGREDPIQRIYWDYEGPTVGAERTHGTRPHLLH